MVTGERSRALWPMAAIADVQGGTLAPGLKGMVHFKDTPMGVWVQAYFTGFPDQGVSRFHGFHIHEKGECVPRSPGETEEFAGAGGHYNPSGAPHPSHAGDMPPLLTTREGAARMCFVTDRFTVSEIIGRSVIVHGGADDFTSQPSGASGPRWGCGVIRPV